MLNPPTETNAPTSQTRLAAARSWYLAAATAGQADAALNLAVAWMLKTLAHDTGAVLAQHTVARL